VEHAEETWQEQDMLKQCWSIHCSQFRAHEALTTVRIGFIISQSADAAVPADTNHVHCELEVHLHVFEVLLLLHGQPVSDACCRQG